MAPTLVLAVMGVTGAGKSSFIKLVTGDESVKIGHSQKSETKHITSHSVTISGQKFTLVDTPGFDDTNLSDAEVLKLLIDWLVATYRSGQKLNGILYLHRITDARMRGSSVKNLKMFKELIGNDFYRNVTLATTCWSLVSKQTGIDRESELSNGSAFWKVLISKGARLERIPDSALQARNLVYQIARHQPVALQTQRDVVDMGKSFQSLSVTKIVENDLEEMKKQHQAELKKLEEERELLRIREELRQKAELERVRARNQRMQEYRSKQNYCVRKKPFGSCDKAGCGNKLQSWKVTWHCCSCSTEDWFWHCGPCGNNCGNDEHPSMIHIDNDDECVVM